MRQAVGGNGVSGGADGDNGKNSAGSSTADTNGRAARPIICVNPKDTTSEVDYGINRILSALGSRCKARSIRIHEFDIPDRVCRTFVWCVDSTYVQALRTGPTGELVVKRGMSVDSKGDSNDSATVFSIFRKNLVYRDHKVGELIAESLHPGYLWPQDERDLLRRVGDIIAQALGERVYITLRVSQVCPVFPLSKNEEDVETFLDKFADWIRSMTKGRKRKFADLMELNRTVEEQALSEFSNTVHSDSEARLTGRGLTIRTLLRIAKKEVKVVIPQSAYKAIEAGRSALEYLGENHYDAAGNLTQKAWEIYGYNTGVGVHKETLLTTEIQRQQFQMNVLYTHATKYKGCGLIPELTMRIALALQINHLASGHGGVTPALVEALVEQLNSNKVPRDIVNPCGGDVGSGAIVPNAHMGLHFVKQSGYWLQPGEALQIISNNNLSIATGILCLETCKQLLNLANFAGCLSILGFQGDPSPFHQDYEQVFPRHGGAVRCARKIRYHLQGSSLIQSRLHSDKGPRKIQDPLDMRTMAPVHGVADEALVRLEDEISLLINTYPGNPAVLWRGDEPMVVTSSNFDTSRLRHAIDSMRSAVTNVVVNSNSRVGTLLDPSLNGGLPTGLGRLEAGMDGMHMRKIPLLSAAANFNVLAHATLPVTAACNINQNVENTTSWVSASTEALSQVLDWAKTVMAAEVMTALAAYDARIRASAHKEPHARLTLDDLPPAVRKLRLDMNDHFEALVDTKRQLDFCQFEEDVWQYITAGKHMHSDVDLMQAKVPHTRQVHGKKK